MASARGRMHGERPQDYAARRAFDRERAAATSSRVPGPTVEVERACMCRAYPFAHYHNPGGSPRRPS